jgi:phenylacetate-CoA ligase
MTLATASSALPRLGDWHSTAELVDRQNAQLGQVLSWARHSPFYRARFASGVSPGNRAEFEMLPLTTKQELRDAYPFGMLAVPKARLATYHESSGTAGTPTPSYYTERDWVDLAQRYARKWVGIGPEDTFLVRTPYALMITGHLAHTAARSHGATVVPGDNRSLAMPYARVVRVLHDLGVTLTWSMPTETLLWASAARAAGHRVDGDFPALRALFVGGEPLSPARHRRISELWGVPVVEEYGSTETGSLAGECREGNLHLWADRAIFEVYDPRTGRIGPEGAGQLVVTPLYREAMPLLRYNLADDVEVSYADCPCGWHLPTVRVLGRSSFGYPVGSVAVNQSRLEELVFSLPAGYGVLFWRGRAAPSGLRIDIEVAAEHARDAAGALTAAVFAEYGLRADVRPVDIGTLVPLGTLTAQQDVIKPRSLFGPDEDWDKAVLYQ